MKTMLIGVIVVGAGIGLLLPADRTGTNAAAAAKADANPVTPAPAVTAPAKRHESSAAPVASSGWGGETRLARAPNGHFFASALVNGSPVEFVVDTGATTVALTEADARRSGIAFDPSRYDVVGTGASGPVRGQEVTINTVSLNGKDVRTLRAVVLEGLEVSLLGQSFLSHIGSISMVGDEMVLR